MSFIKKLLIIIAIAILLTAIAAIIV